MEDHSALLSDHDVDRALATKVDTFLAERHPDA
jgi:hypothetical protein